MAGVVYSPQYDIRFFGLERLHPFDSRKYSRAWKLLRKHFGRRLKELHLTPPRPVNRKELLTVHDESYLDSLRKSSVAAAALELPPLRYLPGWMIDRRVLLPMRWATMGTLVAARAALETGFVINLSGGYHHAKRDRGEGFCIYSDIALAIHRLRQEKRLSEQQRVAYVDLDAHQGDGVCHQFMDDPRVFMFDMYNSHIYPSHDRTARERIDCGVPLNTTCHEREYLDTLERRLPPLLGSASRSEPIGLAIYVAGSDVHRDDTLGGLKLSSATVLKRDLYVVDELRRRQIPTVMLLGGGYSPVSYRLVADSVIRLLEEYG